MRPTPPILLWILLVASATAAFANLPSDLPSDCQDAIDADIRAGAVLEKANSAQSGLQIVSLTDDSGDRRAIIEHRCDTRSFRIRSVTVVFTDLEDADREFARLRNERTRQMGPPSKGLTELTEKMNDSELASIQKADVHLVDAARWDVDEGRNAVMLVRQGESSWVVLTSTASPLESDSTPDEPGSPALEPMPKVADAARAAKVDSPSTIPTADAESREGERAEKVALISAIPPDEMIWAYITLVRSKSDLSDLPRPERERRRAEHNRPVADRIRAGGGIIHNQRSHSGSIRGELPAKLVLEAMSWPEVETVSIRKQHWDVFEPFWDTDTVGSMECPIIDGACPQHCIGVSGSRFDNANNCWSTESTLLVCVRGEGFGSLMYEACHVNMSTGEFFGLTGGGLVEPAFLGWRKCTKSEYQDRMIDAKHCESSP